MRRHIDRTELAVTIVLRGIDPPIERVLIMDDWCTLTDLHHAIQAAFDGDKRARHIFSDVEPFPHGFPPTADYEHDDCAWFRSGDTYGWRPQRRWGDTWTMIDWRDPNVLSEGDTTLSAVFSGDARLHYRCCDPFESGAYAWFTIHADSVGSAESFPVESAEARTIHIAGGRGQTPLSLLAVREYAELLRAYADPHHPDHDGAVARLERAAGPWASFDPARFDPEWVQARLDRALNGEGRGARCALDRLIDALPTHHAVGLAGHVASAGFTAPPAVTVEDATEFVRTRGC
jgi:hypothetical protein